MNFSNEKELAEYIKTLGGTLWLVGGTIRDEFLNRRPTSDRDYMITGVPISKIPFDRVVGKKFPVFLVEIEGVKCEVALARTERKTSAGHKGFEFYTSPGITVEQDLYRRDFTINSMARNVLTGQLVDPYGGQKDLKDRYLRPTNLRTFREDPLRVFRMARFICQLDFPLIKKPYKIGPRRDELESLSPERVWKETLKALGTERPSGYFKILKVLNVLDVWFPELQDLDVPDKHDGTAFHHTMTVLDGPKKAPSLLRFGLLVHDLGKGRTPKENHPSHHGHDELGLVAVESLCKRLKVPARYRKIGWLSCKHHMRLKRTDEMRPGTFIKLVLEDLKDDWSLIAAVSFYDSYSRFGADKNKEYDRYIAQNIRAGRVLEVAQEITGDQLVQEGIKQDKHFGMKLFERRVKRLKQLEKA
jgi:tRNA nucleotidyltransferase (CCA-adding enzyme)